MLEVLSGMQPTSKDMKTIFCLACVVAALTVYGQPTNTGNVLSSGVTSRLSNEVALSANEVKPNEITSGKVSYSGIAVELLKTGNPLQLINPFAPPQYGSPEDNVMPDPNRRGVVDWKIFSINF